MVKRCETCGSETPRYICQECGKAICESCIEPNTWLCINCYRRGKEERLSPLDVENRIPITIKIFFIGFIMTFIGTIILASTVLFYGAKDSFGLIFFLGPIPIILGVGENLIPLLIVATILTALCITIFIIFMKRMNKAFISFI
ncbi:MAG: hypothetical protein QXH24_03820 [Candidatus Bathyarchaeia archaeon]